MTQGTAVVHFDHGKLRLLRDCFAMGAYGTRRMDSEPVSIHFQGASEIRLSFPNSESIAETLGALDDPMTLAFFVSREHVSFRTSLARTELQGVCKEATHFVQRMESGAFARAFGPSDRFTSPLDVFREATQAPVEDALAACKPDREARGAMQLPGAECMEPIRLHLVAIDSNHDESFPHELQGNPCPPGTYLLKHHCAPPREGVGHLCRFGDGNQCRAQCGLGHAGSCNTLGWMYEHGKGVPRDSQAATQAYRNACKLGDGAGCVNLARGLSEQSYPAHAASYLQEACDMGNPLGCARLAKQYALGIGVPQRCDRMSALYHRACRLGLSSACTTYALGGKDLGECEGPSIIHRYSFLQAGCAGADVHACTALARGSLWDLCQGSPIARRGARTKLSSLIPTLEAICKLSTQDACVLLEEAKTFADPTTSNEEKPASCTRFEHPPP